MAKSYLVGEALAHLPDILNDVEAGEEVELTRDGRAVAILLPPQKYEELRSGRPNFGAVYKAFTERHGPQETGLELDSFDSLRDPAAGRRGRP